MLNKTKIKEIFSSKERVKGFTLIEILSVIAIIFFLMWLLSKSNIFSAKPSDYTKAIATDIRAITTIVLNPVATTSLQSVSDTVSAFGTSTSQEEWKTKINTFCETLGWWIYKDNCKWNIKSVEKRGNGWKSKITFTMRDKVDNAFNPDNLNLPVTIPEQSQPSLFEICVEMEKKLIIGGKNMACSAIDVFSPWDAYEYVVAR